MDAKDSAVRLALVVLKDAIYQLLVRKHPDGLQNSAIARSLGLESDHEGAQRDYLSYSLLGLMLKEGRVQKVKDAKSGHIHYIAVK
jgi:hypothetical protein